MKFYEIYAFFQTITISSMQALFAGKELPVYIVFEEVKNICHTISV